MKLHEHQAKDLLERYGVRVPRGAVARSASEAVQVARELHREGAGAFVVKAQVHAGGRGKGGGVKLARSVEEVAAVAEPMLGMMLKTHQTGPEGQEVRAVLVVEAVDIAREFYVGVTLDRQKSMDVIMASTEGGVDIELVAERTPERILKVWIDPAIGLRVYQARRLAVLLGFEGAAMNAATSIILQLYRAYVETDSALMEINPLVLTGDGEVIAADAKINLDDNALYRQAELAALRDEHEEDPLEVEAGRHGLSYVKLDGNVGCMVNGAGLAMATMDIIKLAGGDPANFLDVGGGASVETVEAGFRIILKDPHVEAVLVNIFGGIVRCDRVANGIVQAARNVHIHVPLIVRLQGTNALEGQAILQASGLEIETAILLKEAAEKVTEALARKRQAVSP
jgi:succinyl-CoA synthetase beta subunit